MWFECSACCSPPLKPGQYTDRHQEKRVNALIFAAYDPSSASLGVTVYQMLPFLRELVLFLYSLSSECIDSFGVAMCAEWKMVGFPRNLSWANYLLLPDLSVPKLRMIYWHKPHDCVNKFLQARYRTAGVSKLFCSRAHELIQNMSRARRLTQCGCFEICDVLPNQQIFHTVIIFFSSLVKRLRGPHLARGP